MEHRDGMKLVGTLLVLVGAAFATGFATGCDDGGTGTGTGTGTGGRDATTATSGGDATTGTSSPTTGSATSTTGTTDPSTTSGGTTGVTTGGGIDGIVCKDSYCTLGPYSGYGFVYSDKKDGGASVINQKGSSLCASGVAGAIVDLKYETYWGAGIGVNLMQKEGAMTPVNYVQLGGAGVTISISNPPATEFRAVLNHAGLEEYCAVLKGTSTTLVWSDFNTMCWDKVAPAAKPLPGPPESSALKVQVITGDKDRPFDFCITSVEFK